MKREVAIALITLAGLTASETAKSQVVAADSVMEHVKGNRLSIGGYGEIGYSRNFYSDHVSRYSAPEDHKNDPHFMRQKELADFRQCDIQRFILGKTVSA